jgi:hypothetical protein
LKRLELSSPHQLSLYLRTWEVDETGRSHIR